MTPTARTLAFLRADGWTADVVERWIGPAKVRKDCFGVGDVLAFDTLQTLLVQCTTAGNLAAREKKVRAWAGLSDWVMGERRMVLHGWAKRGARGTRKTWKVREVEVRP